MAEENETKSSSATSREKKSSSQSEDGGSEHDKTADDVEAGPKGESKDNDIIRTPDESAVQETVCTVDGKENEDKSTDGSTEKPDRKKGNEKDTSAAEDEENVSDEQGKTAVKGEDMQPGNKDVGSTKTEKVTADMETPIGKEEKESAEKTENTGKEIDVESSEGKEGEKEDDLQIEGDNTDNEGTASKDKEETNDEEAAVEESNENGEKGLTKDNDGADGTQVDNEEVDKDKKPEESSIKKEVVKTEKNGNEVNRSEERGSNEGEKKKDEVKINKKDTDEKQVEVENENVQEVEKVESTQNESEGGEMAKNENANDGTVETHTDTAIEMSKGTEEKSENLAEKSENLTENQKKGNGEATEGLEKKAKEKESENLESEKKDETTDRLVEKAPENSNEDINKEKNVENDGEDTVHDNPQATKEFPSEKEKNESTDNKSSIERKAETEAGSEVIAGDEDSQVITRDSQDSQVITEDNQVSQNSNADENESEQAAPSENIDDLVEEILAVTDDNLDGEKSKDISPNSKTEDVSLVTSESSEKGDDSGQLSSDGPATEPQGIVKDKSGDNLIEENGAKQAQETGLRVDSGKTGYRVQTDYLTRQVIAKREKEIYLEEKLAETNRDLEIAERKVKDLQLRLKRFVKDDEAKDQKILQMEREYKDLSDQMQRIEDSLDSKGRNNDVGEMQSETRERQRKKSSSKVCVIL